MIDIWLIFVLCIPFVETILHTVIDTLREEDNYVVNHHGGTISASDTKSKKKDNITRVTPLETVSSGKERSLNLIARNEMEEIRARKLLYEHLHLSSELIMNICQYGLKGGLPVIFILFTICYFIVGFSNRGI